MWIVYSRSLSFKLTYLDDATLIDDQADFFQRPTAWWQAFGRDVFEDGSPKRFYRPLMTWSLLIDYRVGGGNLGIYHATNLLYHVVALLLLYRLLVELKVKRSWAILTTLFMAVHPLITQAVVWIPGRNDLLLTVFLLLSIILYIRYTTFRLLKYLIGHMAFFTMALFTKETALVIPIVCVAYSVFYMKKKSVSVLLSRRLIIGWAFIICVWVLMRTMAFGSEAAVTNLGLLGFVKNIPSILVYLTKVVYPVCLSGVPMWQDTNKWPGLLLLLLIIGYVYKGKLWQKPLFQFGVVWFGLSLLPTFIPVEIRSQHHLILEHRFYLPMIGLLMIILSGLPASLSGQFTRYAWIAGSAIFLILATIAYRHTNDFQDSIHFWERAVTCSPHSAIAHANRGTLAYREHDFNKAKSHLDIALELYPQQAYVHTSLAAIAFDEGDYLKAASEAAKEIEHNRTDEALFLLGAAYERLGKLDLAVPYWLEAVDKDPRNWESRMGLLQYFYVVNDKENALKQAYYLNEGSNFIIPSEIQLWLQESN